MWLVYFSAATGVAVVAYLTYFGLKAAKREKVWQRADEETRAGAGREGWTHVSGTEQAMQEELTARRQKARAEQAQMWGETPRVKWDDNNYCWIVFCKNRWFHWRQNLFYRHRILLGETDEVTPPPKLKGPFVAKCDNCGKEYTYRRREVLRHEEELPEGFTPHPLFR
jgi:hypothetical protein